MTMKAMRWLNAERLTYSSPSWLWKAHQDHDTCRAWWSPLTCAKMDPHCGHNGCKAFVISIQDQIFFLRKTFEGRISKKVFRFLVFKVPMGVSTHLMSIQKLLLSLLIKRKDIKTLISFMVSSLKGPLHIQDVT